MELEQIEGTVEDIIYENQDNGYTVFEISGGGTVTVVCGIVGELHAGESVVCRGKYENHATYGRQFHAQECETDMPKDLEAVYGFLADTEDVHQRVGQIFPGRSRFADRAD